MKVQENKRIFIIQLQFKKAYIAHNFAGRALIGGMVSDGS